MHRTLKMPKCGLFRGEIAVVGKGRLAFLRIAVGNAGSKTDEEIGCAWADNSLKLREFLRAALLDLEGAAK